MTDTGLTEDPIQRSAQTVDTLRQEIKKALVGQDPVIDQVLVALLAGGHVLVEGVPGLGKTLLVRSLARCFGGDFSRVQFTPDLMPSDITGHAIFDMQSQQFEVRRGPAFTHLLLADEINRAPAKTQAALLEVMQERQITIEGESFTTGEPFMVLATQNPVEQEGTYPLPEAELDRFMLKIFIDYPDAADEEILVQQICDAADSDGFNLGQVRRLIEPEAVLAIQKLVHTVTVDAAVLSYAVRLARATRDWNGIARGAGPRASIALVAAAKAKALMEANAFVTPDHIKAVALPVLRHRILLAAELEIEGVSADRALAELLEQVEAPRQ
ncbi:MoxR family ATPase [Exilibacterium tricleocarpae]|uniref:MoxR family ATPase n=1 Tax=Exilibacterium tricleocarpae TaxID=2591008 RepID=A0A545T2B7_9GAMM|nr:MoxR family ATPase [Exilibacterium tricleocarpae]TQV71356.1 MoxR family ATPase [Exilibacterium tricleocarpae]